MMLDLTHKERELLMQLLAEELDELAPEIRHTDDRDYREDLRDRRQTVRHLIDRLHAEPASA